MVEAIFPLRGDLRGVCLSVFLSLFTYFWISRIDLHVTL